MSLTKATYSMIDGAPANILDFGAVGDGTTDDTAAIQAALTASYHVVVPEGTYLISSTINVPAHTRLDFQTGLGNATNAYPAAYFIKKATMTTAGITVSSTGYVTNGGLICQNGNTGDGIVLIGNSAKISHFLVHNAGNDGIRIGVDGVTSNFNICEITQCTSQYNGRYGIYINDGKADPTTGANANACTITQAFCQHNGSDGIRLGFSWWTTIINCLTEVNGGYGLYLSSDDKDSYPAARWVTVVGGDYNEGNTSGPIFDESYFSTFLGQDFNSVPAVSTSPLQGSGQRIFLGSATMNSPAGITFPAVQFNNTDPNTLDDYEEGTWTPTQSGVTLTVGSATYTKIGRLVQYTFDITWPVTANATLINILGFVHPQLSNSGSFSCGYTTYAYVPIGVSGSAGLALYNAGGVPQTQLTNANLSGIRIVGSGTYITNT